MASKAAKTEPTSKLVSVPSAGEATAESEIPLGVELPSAAPIANDAQDQETVPDAPKPPQASPPKKSRGALFRLVKLALWCGLIGAIAVAGYLGWPEFRERYIQPVENTASDLTAVTERLSLVETRLQGAETDGLAQDLRLQALEGTVEELRGDVDDLQLQIDRHSDRIGSLEGEARSLSTRLGESDKAAARQTELAIATEYLSRARLFLYQANYGLAEQDVTAAVATLAALDPEPGLTAVIDRLIGVEEQLPERPVAAADDLDVAWYDLLGSGPSTGE